MKNNTRPPCSRIYDELVLWRRSPHFLFRPHTKFSPSDDSKLQSLVEKFGRSDWSQIAQQMEGKNARQCRERWTNYLAPNLNTAPWTREDDLLLAQKYAELGNRWVQIAAFFPNRTDAMIKNRFNRLWRRQRTGLEMLARHDPRLLPSETLAAPPRSMGIPQAVPSAPVIANGQSDVEYDFESEGGTEPLGFPEDTMDI
jgi:hypothetical protein